MRKFILFVCLSFFVASSGISQTVNGIPLNELNTEYIRVSAREITLSRKINIDLDYGQPYRIKNTRVIDKNGKDMEFNSMIQVLNFMNDIGYELVHGGDNISSFLLRKKKVQR